jgi:hypothetical protein
MPFINQISEKVKKNFVLISILLFGIFFSTFAKKVEIHDAKLVGRNFFYERIKQYQDISYNSLAITEVFSETKNDIPLYYIFNFKEKGYIIVSADDAIPPVLAYSFEGRYSKNDQAPQFAAWMQQYSGQIEHAIRSGTDHVSTTLKEWNRLLSIDPLTHPAFNGRDVQPFITSRWNQGYPYNEMCPAGGSGVHAVVGCVPVAMGQIMYYYRWPETGTGSYTYMDSTYGIQHVAFDSTTYKWNNMKASISESSQGIPELLYHLGVSCDLVYGPDGSGMYNHKAAYSLRTYFKYSPQTQYVFRDSTSLDWDSLIIAHLDRRMPLYYAGWSVPNIMGHAFVCDGYQGSDFFHFNFGWGGSSDGYFYLDNLVPGGNDFNLAQELIINCYPDTVNYSYPVYCNGTENVINYREGTIEDGSGPFHPYNTPASCSWLFMPQGEGDSISNINLTFDNFDINPDDSLIIYDGSDPASPVLGSFSGNTLPAPITSTGNTLLVLFKAHGGAPAPGWSFTYSSASPVWCKGTMILTADTAEVSDGSFRFDYFNNSNCKWKLTPDNVDTLTVYFKYFDTEPGMDILRIYEPDSSILLASISGHYDALNPPPPVTSPSGKMFLVFTSNGSVTGEGWELYYPKSTLGLSENTMHELNVYPNPAQDRFTINFRNDSYQDVTFELLNLTGEKIFHDLWKIAPGLITKTIGTETLSGGLYLLKITTRQEVITRKLIIAH